MGGQIIFGAMEMTRATWTMEMCKKNKTIKDKKKKLKKITQLNEEMRVKIKHRKRSRA